MSILNRTKVSGSWYRVPSLFGSCYHGVSFTGTPNTTTLGFRASRTMATTSPASGTHSSVSSSTVSVSSGASPSTSPTATTVVPAAPIVPQLLVNPNFHPSIVKKQEKAVNRSSTTLIGAVAYCEAISSIWKGIARHFYRQGVDVDFVLFTSYERLVDSLVQQQIHIAWNGPLAHARFIRLMQKGKGKKLPKDSPMPILSLGMRDVDRDFRTHIIVRKDANISSLTDIANRRVAVGTVDSPQSYIMPLEYLHRLGIPLNTLSIFRFDRDIGKHGDTAYGEDSTLEALANGTVEVGFISDLMWQRYITANRIPMDPQTNQPLLQILPLIEPIAFDHCQFDALPTINSKRADEFQRALLSMDGSGHPEDKRTLELEGIKSTWLPPRNANDPQRGYENMLNALKLFNDPVVKYPGVLHTHKNHPFKHLMIDNRVVLDSFGC